VKKLSQRNPTSNFEHLDALWRKQQKNVFQNK